MEIQYLSEENFHYLVDWNKRTNPDFLQQWAGPYAYSYPICENQIAARIADGIQIYMVKEKEQIIGTFELDLNFGKKQAFLSRVLFAESSRGQGFGTRALKLMADELFSKYSISKIILHVYCFNTEAVRCYEKAGFQITATQTDTNPKWNSYTMEYHRSC